MVQKTIFLVLIMFTVSVYATPLIVNEVSPGSFDIRTEVNFDGDLRSFTLDTGANRTSVVNDSKTENYISKVKVKSRGASSSSECGEVKVACDVIKPAYIKLDQVNYSYPEVKRCRYNLLGMDMLGNNVVELNFSDKKMSLSSSPLPANSSYPLERLEGGAPKVDVSVADVKLKALFDTGAQMTAVDVNYAKNNPQLFKLTTKKGGGKDALGCTLSYDIFEMAQFKVGSLTIENLKVIAFDFGSLADFLGKDAPIILGADVMVKANWILDLGSNRWAVAPGNL